jgi:hypothetical protein
MEDVESMDQLIASGANFIQRYSRQLFWQTKTGILSPNPGNTTQIIVKKQREKLVNQTTGLLKFTMYRWPGKGCSRERI